MKINYGEIEAITKCIDKYINKIKVKLDTNLSLPEKFLKILQRINNSEDEEAFLREIGTLCGIKYIENNEHEIERIMLDIDIDKINETTIQKIREKMFIPLKRAYLCINPFIEIYNTTILLCSTSMFTIVLTKIQERFGKTEDIESSEQFLREVLEYAFVNNISDVHIEFDAVLRRTIVRIRRDGLLYTYKEISNIHFHEILSNKIFELAGINSNDFLKLHDQKILYNIFNKSIPIRVSAVPVLTNSAEISNKLPSFVLRFLTSAGGGVTSEIQQEGNIAYEMLGFENDSITVLKRILAFPSGMVVFCGATGSGKTTTLYTLLLEKKKEPVKIVTIEDPVEVKLPGITQVEVKEENNVTFSSAIRAFLRHDPDVILIGEVRDSETAVEALRAAITGHLVLTTLHTNTSHGAITRLIDLGADRLLLAEALKAIISQRLVRKLCTSCKIRISISSDNDEEDRMIEKYFSMTKDEFRKSYPFFAERGINAFYVRNPEGCKKCEGRGYSGRTILYEIVRVNENIAKKIVEGEYITHSDIFKSNEKLTMLDTAIRKIEKGETTIEEVERFIVLNQRQS